MWKTSSASCRASRHRQREVGAIGSKPALRPRRADGGLPRRRLGPSLAGQVAIRWSRATSSRRSRAAQAIGDDRLQRKTQGQVVPDSFTHGSSAQRVRWLTTGLKEGSVRPATRSARPSCRAPMPGIDASRGFVPLDHRGSDRLGHPRRSRTTARATRWWSASRKPGTRSATAPSCRTRSSMIRRKVKAWIANPAIDVVITTGGTGFTGRDVTPEAIEPLFEKRMDGFSAVFHRISLRHDRHLDHPVAGDGRARRHDLHLRAARLARAPARTPGTGSWRPSSITATAPAISSRSCRGSTST